MRLRLEGRSPPVRVDVDGRSLLSWAPLRSRRSRLRLRLPAPVRGVGGGGGGRGGGGRTMTAIAAALSVVQRGGSEAITAHTFSLPSSSNMGCVLYCCTYCKQHTDKASSGRSACNQSPTHHGYGAPGCRAACQRAPACCRVPGRVPARVPCLLTDACCCGVSARCVHRRHHPACP